MKALFKLFNKARTNYNNKIQKQPKKKRTISIKE